MHSKNTHQFTQLLKHLDFTDTQRSLDNIAKLEEDVEEDSPYELDLSDYGFITIFGLILIIGLIYCAINFRHCLSNHHANSQTRLQNDNIELGTPRFNTIPRHVPSVTPRYQERI